MRKRIIIFRRAHIQINVSALPANLLLFGIGVIIWQLFRPGLLSVDSIDQYTQAVTGDFNNWHPPIMAAILSQVISCGLGIDSLIFLQCQLGLFGIKSLIVEFLHRFVAPHRCTRAGFVSILSVGLILLLMIPITPHIFYLVTFWKDVWLAISLIWLFSLLLKLTEAKTSLSTTKTFYFTIGILGLGVFAASVRHNALPLLPLIIVLTVLLIKDVLSRLQLTLVAILPMVVFLLLGVFIKERYRVVNSHIENVVIASDLVGICVVAPNACKDLPLTQSAIINKEHLSRYVFGISAHFYSKEYLIVDPEYVGIGTPNLPLKNEYRTAIINHPVTLLKVKYHALLSLLRPKQKAYNWYQSSIEENRYNLQFNDEYRAARETLIGFGQAISQHRYLHWISGEHLVWLMINLILLARYATLFFQNRLLSYLAVMGMLVVTLAYYLSYIFVVTQWDFRFMYPSTLFVQILFICNLIEAFLGRKRSLWLHRQS